MGLKVSEASAFDLLETLDDLGGRARVTRLRFGQMARQVSGGPALTWRDADGLLVMVAGLWPEGDHVEAWVATGPAFRRRFRSALAALERAVTASAAMAGPFEARVYVRAGDRVAGARMARWSGFEKIGAEGSPIGPVEVFSRSFGGPPDGAAD